MNEDRLRILTMLSQGKVTPEEADQLLQTLDSGAAPSDGAGPKRTPPKYLRVVVDKADGGMGQAQKVNVRVPMNLVRAGVKLAALLPPAVHGKVNAALKEQGIDLDIRAVKPEHLEEMVEALAELTVDVQNPGENVRVFCE